MKPLVAIVNSSSFGKLFPDHMQRLSTFSEVRRLSFAPVAPPGDIVAELKPYHGAIVSVSPRLTEEILEELPNLVLICRHGIGLDNIDVKAATRLGICVSRVPGIVEQEAVAEHTILLMLAASRQLVQARDSLLRGNWSQRAQFIGTELRQKRIGLIGFGNVGRRVGQILRAGFNAEVVAFDPFLTEEEISSQGVKRVSFEELLTGCSMISLHCSLNESSYRCIGEKEFALMQKGVILVNTARGDLLDERALEEALARGFVGAYAADVSENMPTAAENPLLKFPNVLILPHLGSYTLESLRGMGDTMVTDLERVFVHDSIPENIVDRGLLDVGLRIWRK